jgi:diacylglycerol O-acyltransferase
MGGSIAQLLWRHHRPLVNGLVLAATGAEFRKLNRHKYAASSFLVAAAGTRMGAGATWLPRQIGKSLGTERANDHSASPLMVWGRQEVAGHSSRVMLEAAHAIANFSSKKWVDQIDVPTSVIVTEHDTAVMPQSQIRMAMAIPGAHINRIPGGHMSCIDPDFGRKLTDACLDVQHRIDAGYNPLRPDA